MFGRDIRLDPVFLKLYISPHTQNPHRQKFMVQKSTVITSAINFTCDGEAHNKYIKIVSK